jgi:cation/acetate symporter
MVLGLFWRGMTRQGAVAGMLAGFGVTAYYMLAQIPALRAGGVLPRWLFADGLWWGIEPVAAGVFGVPVGFIVAVGWSWWSRVAGR